jgi:hypothetical protein
MSIHAGRTGFAQALGLMSYSPRFLDLRRLIHKALTGNMLQKYWPLHEEESRTLIKKTLLDPSFLSEFIRQYFLPFGLYTYISHLPSYSGSVILRVTYGYQTATQNDRFLLLAEKVMRAFALASQPGA